MGSSFLAEREGSDHLDVNNTCPYEPLLMVTVPSPRGVRQGEIGNWMLTFQSST
jgi:hypothetical protein